MTSQAQLRADADRAARDVAFAVLDWMQTPSTTGLLAVHAAGRAFRRAELAATTTPTRREPGAHRA